MFNRAIGYEGNIKALATFLYLRDKGLPRTQDNFDRVFQNRKKDRAPELVPYIDCAAEIETLISYFSGNLPDETTLRLQILGGADTGELLYKGLFPAARERFLQLVKLEENGLSRNTLLAQEITKAAIWLMKENKTQFTLENFVFERLLPNVTIEQLAKFNETLFRTTGVNSIEPTDITEDDRFEILYLSVLQFVDLMKKDSK